MNNGHYSKISEIVFTPDSKSIISGYTNGKIEIRELKFFKILKIYDH